MLATVADLKTMLSIQHGDDDALLARLVGAASEFFVEQVKRPIEAWADLWDPSLAGKLLCPAPAAGSMYELVMIAARINGADNDYAAASVRLATTPMIESTQRARAS